jgi:hypothetical protein
MVVMSRALWAATRPLTPSPAGGTCPSEGVPVSDTPFHQARMSRDSFDRTMPGLVKQLARIADLLETLVARRAEDTR